MCLCNGTGKINIEHEWGVHFTGCPDTACTFDRVFAIEWSVQRMDKIIHQLNVIEYKDSIVKEVQLVN